MSELEDIKLKALLHEMKLESPNKDFSVKVMNKIFEENSLLEKVKKEKILGKGFWIILLLFILLFAAQLLLPNAGVSDGSEALNSFFGTNNQGIANEWQNILNKSGSLPMSIAGIFLASSTLLFIERFITANTKLF